MSLFDQINTAENFNEDVTKEKHLPTITATKLEGNRYRVRIDVGQGKHPNEIDHWIQWTELRVQGLFIGRAEFSAKIMEPIAEFVVNLEAPASISALSRCNKHGLWETSIKVG
ncbi:MAG TPA: desulfoferrodoxin family protein [Spirochaetota bacterium]|nr:desulfoferrodoxin family protein [Spirochaetota bacterium]HPH03251.1 desulfoferrodoxin family protein [Spirochaetota bacterium]